jgi:hypothetical protein
VAGGSYDKRDGGGGKQFVHNKQCRGHGGSCRCRAGRRSFVRSFGAGACIGGSLEGFGGAPADPLGCGQCIPPNVLQRGSDIFRQNGCHVEVICENDSGKSVGPYVLNSTNEILRGAGVIPMPNDFFAMTPESSSDMTLKQQAKQQRELHSIQINAIQCKPEDREFF